MKRFSFMVRIQFEDDEEVDRDVVKEHIKVAVLHWGAGGDPDGPFWPDNLKVEVK